MRARLGLCVAFLFPFERPFPECSPPRIRAKSHPRCGPSQTPLCTRRVLNGVLECIAAGPWTPPQGRTAFVVSFYCADQFCMCVCVLE